MMVKKFRIRDYSLKGINNIHKWDLMSIKLHE